MTDCCIVGLVLAGLIVAVISSVAYCYKCLCKLGTWCVARKLLNFVLGGQRNLETNFYFRKLQILLSASSSACWTTFSTILQQFASILVSRSHWINSRLIERSCCVCFSCYYWNHNNSWYSRQGKPSVQWHCQLGGRKGIRPVKNWVVGCWHGYLSERGADLPTWVVPEKGPLNGCMYICVYAVDKKLIFSSWLHYMITFPVCRRPVLTSLACETNSSTQVLSCSCVRCIATYLQ